jgi:hypothetical protein
VNALEGFFHVGGIEPDQGILPYLSAMNSLDLDFVDRAFAPLLSQRHIRRNHSEDQRNQSKWSSVPHKSSSISGVPEKLLDEKRPDGISPALISRIESN